MICFPHRWLVDRHGVVRCFKELRPFDDSPDLPKAIKIKLRRAVQGVCAATLSIETAQIRLHGWGRVEADGVAKLLSDLDAKMGDWIEEVARVEEAILNTIEEKWALDGPNDYKIAKFNGETA